MLSIEVIQSEPVLVLSVRGRFDSSGAVLFEKEFDNFDTLFPVLDLSEVSFLSSAGIRVLLKTEKFLRQQNGKVILSSAGDHIKQVFEITGLINQFTFFETLDNAVDYVVNLHKAGKEKYEEYLDNISYSVKKLSDDNCRAGIWSPGAGDPQQLIAASLNDFDIAVGYGGIGTTRDSVKNSTGRMLLTKNFIGVLPADYPGDYILSRKPEETFMFISSAVNFGGTPNYFVKSATEGAAFGDIIKNSLMILSDMNNKPVTSAGFLLIADITDSDKSVLSIGIIGDKLTGTVPEVLKSPGSLCLDENIICNSVGVKLKSTAGLNEDLYHSLNSVFYDENISEVFNPDKNLSLSLARLWIFIPEYVNAQESRLKIIHENSVELRDEFEVIIRSIYSDCSSIELQQLHGGFSAKTFRVYGYDKRGIRILPTVLKLAKRTTIQREVRSYEESVKRYILNNSTSILGSCYYGNFGGVRYNFVGITGPESRICWLTDYYRTKSAEELIPVFDRIFTDILRPWYGQPRLETFFPFKEHNPTFVFFPELFEKCEEVFGISADEPRVFFKELGREIVNPYWFLKYGYKEREKMSKLWYKCICHGDLNMQNILLDEIMNIYIIDYSETSVRNAVADFARLEPIFKFEFPVIDDQEFSNLIKFEEGLLKVNKLDEIPEFTYPGSDPFIEKAYKMICRLRKYAKTVTIFENDLVPYLLAVLEWTFAVVCYQSVDLNVKKYSAISAALICEKILELEKAH